MRLSTVFELLLIFLFLALASSRHIDKKRLKKGVTKQTNLNPYCKCTELQCNCCRDFPVVPIKGPGCATLGYQSGDSLRLTMSFGDRVLRNITLAGKRPKPVCMGLPGGISKFCGRLYNIQRVEDQFKACLSLELRALDELEAALRVSCFNFGPKGVKLEPGEPLPSVSRPADEDDDDDDDYDIDDDDDDDDEFDDDDDEYNDVDTDGDYTSFAALSDQLFEGFFFPTVESNSNKKKKPARPVTQESFVDLELTTKATAVLNDTKEVSTTEVPQTVVSSTQRILETTKGPSAVVSSTSSSPQKVTASEKTEDEITTEEVTDATATESVISNEEKENSEAENSASEEVTEQENDEKEIEPEATERDEEESDEGSAEEELDDTENEEASQVKLENDDNDDDDDDDDDDEDSEEDHESVEHDEEKDEDNILNVFFNHDDDSTEKERERTRMEREKFKKILPGLMVLLQPSPTPPTDDLSASFSYPAVRSARQHRRMRLPPI